ncbi:MAG: aldehyde dehydrogenase family protein [Candidatus Omnitrophica bacterium]|nr:aldehyde dehydrogenase family protein [Candidatus Omnitrophota bacterium]MBU1870120.1 aldehyde dehydrogenase family protein [Candidatus Omnitrophota bacterium]
MSSLYPLFINGELLETKQKEKIFNPANGEEFAEVCLADEAVADSAIQSARLAFDKGPWKNLGLSERKDFILKIAQGILDNAAQLAQLETLNTGKPLKESTFMDIPSSAETFKYFAENLEQFLKAEEIKISSQIAGAQGNLLREPMGVVVLIVPWNYPLLIASWKMAQALAAGNCVILKPSTLTPLTALALAKIINDAGLPKGVVNIITGSGDKLGKVLCSDKRVDMVSFTGSNEVGKKVLEYLSENVKKPIMELGGKSAGIVLKDADLELAVNGSLCSIFLNQGQMCTAMSRILVEDEIYDRFIKDFTEKARRIKLGDGMDFQTQMGPLISESQRKKILEYVQKAVKEGAKVTCGGKIPQAQDLKKGFFFEPTVIADVTKDMVVFKEEIFGPVVCVTKFSGIEEAVRLANSSDFALAGCIWSKDEEAAKRIAGKIDTGTIWINTYGMFFNELPFGGFKQSGFGKELGKAGFLEYTRLKNVVVDKTEGAKPLINYWYGF